MSKCVTFFMIESRTVAFYLRRFISEENLILFENLYRMTGKLTGSVDGAPPSGRRHWRGGWMRRREGAGRCLAKKINVEVLEEFGEAHPNSLCYHKPTFQFGPSWIASTRPGRFLKSLPLVGLA